MSLKLYHYAKVSQGQFTELLTERARAHKKHIGIRAKYPSYCDHVSFFFAKPPLKTIAEIYKKAGKTHPFWKDREELFEYVVDISKHRGTRFQYRIVENPEKTELLYDDSLTDDQFYDRRDKIEKELGYNGDSVVELVSAVERLLKRLPKNFMEEGYRALPKRNNFHEIWDKYAPTIPHLMLYDDVGKFRIESVEKVVVGSSKPIALESAVPQYTLW